MRRSLLAVLALVALPSGARAEVGGPAVNVRVPLNTPLGSELRAKVTADDARVATFVPPTAVATCLVDVVARPTTFAARSAEPNVARAGGFDQTWATGRTGSLLWRVRAGGGETPTETAIAVARYAPKRFAGVRIDVDFDPACAPAAPDSQLADALVTMMRGTHVKARRG